MAGLEALRRLGLIEDLAHPQISRLGEMFLHAEDLVTRRIKDGYYVTAASGDLTIDRLLGIIRGHDDLRVVSSALLRRLTRDDEFRKTFARDIYLYRPGVGIPIETNTGTQEYLF